MVKRTKTVKKSQLITNFFSATKSTKTEPQQFKNASAATKRRKSAAVALVINLEDEEDVPLSALASTTAANTKRRRNQRIEKKVHAATVRTTKKRKLLMENNTEFTTAAKMQQCRMDSEGSSRNANDSVVDINVKKTSPIDTTTTTTTTTSNSGIVMKVQTFSVNKKCYDDDIDTIRDSDDEKKGAGNDKKQQQSSITNYMKVLSGDELMLLREAQPKKSFQNSMNIVHALYHRTVHGARKQPHQRCSNTENNTIRNHCVVSTRMKWKVPKFISFTKPSINGSSLPVTAVTTMAWDADGVLLAVAYGNCIAIYDWDTVKCTNLNGRRERQRQQQQQTNDANVVDDVQYMIDPILYFPVYPMNTDASNHKPPSNNSIISILKWNPSNPDQLIVGLRSSGSIFLFDLPTVGEWLEARQHHQQQQSSMFDDDSTTRMRQPPCQELRCYTPGPRQLQGNVGGAVISLSSTFLFIQDHALLAAGSAIFCWQLSEYKNISSNTATNEQQQQYQVVNLKWKYQYKKVINCMIQLTDDTVLLGTDNGTFAILDWKRMQQSTFAIKSTPTIRDEWVSYDETNTSLPTKEALSICHVQLRQEQVIPNKYTLCRIIWLTRCGWVLSSLLELPCKQTKQQRLRRREGCTIHVSTNPIQWVDHKGENVSTSKRQWNYPASTMKCQGTDTFFVWKTVPDDVTKQLDHYDLHVLKSSSTQQQHEKKKKKKKKHCVGVLDLTSLHRVEDEKQFHRRPNITVPNCGSTAQPQQQRCNTNETNCVSMHPSNEWIVVGTRTQGLFAMCEN